MTTIFERVNSALATLDPVPFAMAPYQGQLPNLYIVYQLITSLAGQHADNEETERADTVQVTTWNTDGLVDLPDVDTVMKTAGFKKVDVRQIPRDKGTGHYGLATDYLYLETKE